MRVRRRGKSKSSSHDHKDRLSIGSTADHLEDRADRAADHATSPAAPRLGATLDVGRLSEAATSETPAPESVDRALATPGHPLEPRLRHDMEGRFAHDFSRVRLHTGAIAEHSARDVGANAYTAGQDIVLGAMPAAGTRDDRHTIAHELSHVVQQSTHEHAMVQREPAQKRKPAAKRVIIAISAKPHSTEGAMAYVKGEKNPIPIFLKVNELDQGKYAYIKHDDPSTPFVEFDREDGGKAPFTFIASTNLVAADRLHVEIQAEEFDLASYAKSEFDAVPERIRTRLVIRGGQKLATPEEQLGFANFAKALMDRHVTDEELALFEDRARKGMLHPGHRLDWATEWQSAADIVIGARARLETAAAQNVELFQGLSSAIPELSDRAYQAYRMSQWMPELRPLAWQMVAQSGMSVGDLEAIRDSMMDEFDFRLRLETDAALDRLQGGLLVTRERYVADKGALAKIDAMRAAVKTPEVQQLRTHMKEAESTRDSAVAQLSLASMPKRFGGSDDQRAESQKDVDSASTAYDRAKADYLDGLQKISGVPVASWRGFNIDTFFYSQSSERSRAILESFVLQTLGDVARARLELSKDKRTIYKADIMVRHTKQVLGVTADSIVEKLVDERVEDYKSAPWWEKLLDILSLALIFVPGGAIVTAARLAVGIAQTINTADSEAVADTFSRAEIKNEGGSTLSIVTSIAGNALDIGDAARVFGAVEKTATKAASAGSRIENTAAKVADATTKTAENATKTAAETAAKTADTTATTAARTETTATREAAADVPKPAPTTTPTAPPNASTAPHPKAPEPPPANLPEPPHTDLPKPPETDVPKTPDSVVREPPPTKPQPPSPPPPPPSPPPPPRIQDRTPTYQNTDEAFSSLKQELKDVPEATGPVKGQRLGAASPGPVRPTPTRTVTPEAKAASDAAGRDMAAQTKQDVLAELQDTAPTVHADVVKPGRPLQSGEKLEDWAIKNPERVKQLHAEWVDGVAKGNIKKETDFSSYVRKRIAGDRGFAGELEDAFVRGPDEILVKAPKPKSNLRGTDSMSYRVQEDRIKYLDNKSITTGGQVGKVSAVEKNLIQNISEDIDDIERALRLPDVPPEIRDKVLPRLKSARAELKEYVTKHGLRPEDLYRPDVRDAFDSILRNNKIDRVVTFGGAAPGVTVTGTLTDTAGFATERP